MELYRINTEEMEFYRIDWEVYEKEMVFYKKKVCRRKSVEFRVV